ncbi:MAG: hypothetical protein U5L45_23980 [Saprospiraceae bacterium]|nr:hypothetical protein [Saprospiraceae bacterium]
MIIDDLLKDLKSRFSLIADPRKGDNTTIKLVDVFLNSFAIFSLKDESLNIYVKQFKQRLPNLKKLFGIRRCPSDTALREILDEVPPESLQSLSVQYIDLLFVEGHTDCFELNAVNLKKHFYVMIDARLDALRQAFPDNGEIALREAMAAVNVTSHAGEAGDWPRVEAMFARLDALRQAFPDNGDIALREAMAAVNVTSLAGVAGRLAKG